MVCVAGASPMKILVISVLRIGDVLIQAPVIRGLKEKYPGAEIHFLINDVAAGIVPMITFVDKFWIFERRLLQRGLGEPRKGFFNSYTRLSQLVDSLNQTAFDLVINLTHNRVSARLMNEIQSVNRIGLSLDKNGRPHFGSDWFRYLNDHVSRYSGDCYHYADIFGMALGLRSVSQWLGLSETPKGIAECEAALETMSWQGSAHPLIAVQAFTSDPKKNWDIMSFGRMIESASYLIPKYKFVVVCAEAELAGLSPLAEFIEKKSLPAKILPLSLEGAYSLLKKSALLVTGDTSIKHLAAHAGVPVIELSLGSSDYRKTGVYSFDGLIVQTKEPCAPCHHREPCRFVGHPCAGKITPEAIALCVDKLLRGDKVGLGVVSNFYVDEIKILSVGFDFNGNWMAKSLQAVSSVSEVASTIHRVGWKFLLENKDFIETAPYGSELAGHFDSIRADFKFGFLGTISEQLQAFARDLQAISLRVDSLSDSTMTWSRFLRPICNHLLK